MSTFLKYYCKSIDYINKFFGFIAAWLTFLVVVVITTDVIMRYIFNTGYVMIQELQWHLFAMIIMLGAGATLQKDAHVRVDIFYQQLSPKNQAWVNLLGTLFFLMPACYFIIDETTPFVMNAYNFSEHSPDPGGIPYRFFLKSMIPFGFTLIFLQGTAMLIRSAYIILDLDLGEE